MESALGANQHTRVRQNGEGSPDRFTLATATATGQSERSVQRAAERGEKLKDVLPDIVGTSLDRPAELDALKSRSINEQAELARRAKAGERVSAKSSPKPNHADARFAALQLAWRAADDITRRRFLSWVKQQEAA